MFSDLTRLLDELPDELGTLDGTSIPAQNGAKDPSMLAAMEQTTQKHQQLSQLLSSNSTPVPSNNSPQNQITVSGANLGGLGNSLNSLNSVKSPLTNNLSSPNVAVSRAPTSTPSSMNNDILTNVSYSSIAAGIGNNAVSSSPIFSSMSMVNTLNKPMTSQALMNSGNANMHQPNQIMNGPHLGIGSGAGVARSGANTMGGMSSLQGTLSPGMMPNTNMNSTMTTNQLDMNHPSLSTPPTQMIQVGFTLY